MRCTVPLFHLHVRILKLFFSQLLKEAKRLEQVLEPEAKIHIAGKLETFEKYTTEVHALVSKLPSEIADAIQRDLSVALKAIQPTPPPKPKPASKPELQIGLYGIGLYEAELDEAGSDETESDEAGLDEAGLDWSEAALDETGLDWSEVALDETGLDWSEAALDEARVDITGWW
jgi:hypothetical protein